MTSPSPTSPTAPASAREQSAIRKVAAASGFGTAIELYDFLIYGLAAALVFNKLFFPLSDPIVGTLLAFATFGVGFVARPLGGLVIGHFGDRLGRRQMLVLTLTATGACTTLIGLLPTYDQIGVLAPVALVVLRVLQGFFMGGEQGGAFLMVTEHARPGTKAWYGSWATSGSPVGSFLGIGIFTIMSAVSGDQFLTWGWRVPFLLSAILVLVGIYVRLGLTESPEFEELRGTNRTVKLPLGQVLRTSPGLIVAGILVNMGFNMFIFIINTFSISYGTETLGMQRSTLLNAGLLGSVSMLVTVLLASRLADRIGLTRVMVAGGIFLVLFAFPYFWLFQTADPAFVTWAIVLGYAGGGVIFGPMAAYYAALFDGQVRYTGVSLSYQVGAVLGGGFSPAIATWLLQTFDSSTTSISAYLAFGALLALAGLWWTRHRIATAFAR
ncbi:MFS transporter [Saxibacter everestensis]|uniref:MFS transporter n=1 Tax=Saxibacter everestensis TaxID=2909229 RepID=A0ABY8QVI4_9MICO|nr:MFS transporter [Brevibacteriaceae bacterium ZFBP1038]